MTERKDPWRPPALRGRQDIDEFLYVVVEEEIDDTIGLVAAEWPRGGHGSPHFPEEAEEFEVAVDREALRRCLSKRQVPVPGELSAEAEEALQTRGVAVGDVFAIRPQGDLSADADPEWLRGCEWMGETIDVTAEAREAAKARMYEALTPPLKERVAEHLLAESEQATRGPA